MPARAMKVTVPARAMEATVPARAMAATTAVCAWIYWLKPQRMRLQKFHTDRACLHADAAVPSPMQALGLHAAAFVTMNQNST